MSKTTKKLVIIDSNALVHRAFHALPPLTNKEGVIINAVYGYTSILLKTIKDLKPSHIVATFDMRAKTFRHKEFEGYKAKRTKAPQELYDQIPLVKKVLEAFNIPIYEVEGFEADDVIGTICHMKSIDRPDIESIVVTGDQDTLQLVDSNTFVFSPHKGMSETILYNEELVTEKFDGLRPDQLIDYKALRGDPSDNIPGVAGIGHKGAVNLLLEFKTLDGIYKNLDSDKIKDRTRQLLTEHKKDAFMSQRLATIVLDVDVDFKLKDAEFAGFNKKKVLDVFQKFNFKRLMSQLDTLDGDDQIKISGGQGNLFSATTTREQKKGDYALIKNKKEAEELLDKLKKQKEFCFDTETTGVNPFADELLGISFCWEKEKAYYLPIDMIGKVKKDLEKIFKDEKIKKNGHNLKFDVEVMQEAGFEVAGIYFDTMVASYILNPSSRGHKLDTLAFTEFGYQMQPISDLIGKGRDQITLKEVDIEKVSWYSCEDADMTWQLYQKLQKEVEKEGMTGLLEKIDMPLVEVLVGIEKNGVKIDDKKLKKLSDKFEKEIIEIKKQVYKLSGTEFNLASPLQLKEVLFGKLDITTVGLSRTKTGISTAHSELEKLAEILRDNDSDPKHIKIIDLILNFREISKLKNTYLDALPKLINKGDGRVHTSFNQTVTATGRLSSSEPNLQNIPIRTEQGNKIREAFIAEKGFKIVKADYSQIELRIVASLADDKDMLSAFENKIDIHTKTAAMLNDVKPEEVTKEMRYSAKAVNFGVLYGMGAFGLSKQAGISVAEARQFIAKYFEGFSGVKKYIDETIEIAKDKGYVETFYGRRRYIPEIESGAQQMRAFAERTAVNTPIQGTAADLIKLAMIKVHEKLPKISPRSKMILQVHDELVFEVPEKEVGEVAKFIEKTMNEVCELRVPIETEVCVGDSWGKTEGI